MKFMELDIQRFAGSPVNVHYNGNGADEGSSMPTDYIYSQGNISECTFTKEHYIFDHWNTEADDSGNSYEDRCEGSIIYETEGFSGGEDLTLYAQWVKDPSGKYLTFGNLQRYDTKIKDYVNDSITELTTIVENTVTNNDIDSLFN